MSKIAGRTRAFERIYEYLMNADTDPLIEDDTDNDADTLAFANILTQGVIAHDAELRSEIELHAIGYDIGRIYKVDLAILMLAVYEIKYAADVVARLGDGSTLNKAISCNEAVNLAKKYSTIKSPSFVNGILSKIN